MKEEILKKLIDLGWQKSQITTIEVVQGVATICLEVDLSLGNEIEDKRQEAEKEILSLAAVTSARIIVTAERNTPPQPPKVEMRKPPVRENLKPAQIKHIIAISSGKGGVGKSTVAVNLAISLSRLGLSVGVMDADIYGPSLPKMLNLEGQKAQLNAQKKLDVLHAYDMAVMSIGFLVDADQPMIWRGPMVQSAIRQFLVDVDWPALDVLVVDMPPGTGDAQLTMAQKVPLSGAVIVSTPQDIALIDAAKGIEMFRQTNVDVLGIVENMSVFCCPGCGEETPIFGQHGAIEMAAGQGIDVLGEIPLDIKIREHSDSGKPLALTQDTYAQIAQKVRDKLFQVS